MVERPSTHKYNTISRTKIVNHVTSFKNVPKPFPIETTENIKLHIGSEYHDPIDPQKYIITVEPMAKHIQCETIGKYWDTQTYYKRINQFLQTQCEMNLAVCPRDEITCRN